ncbi:MAG: DUF4340 domain-containing protein [Anaerolineales bacterium]
MLRKNTLILVVVFAVVVVAAILIQRTSEDAPVEPTGPAVVPTRFLFEFGAEVVAGFRVAGPGGQAVEMSKDNEGVWSSIEPPAPAEDTDQTQVTTTVSQLASVRVLNDLEGGPLLDALGLDFPSHVITIALQDDEQKIIQIGDSSPTGNGYYVRVNSGDPQLVDKIVFDRFIGFLDAPPIIPTPTITPTLEITSTQTLTPTLPITSTVTP